MDLYKAIRELIQERNRIERIIISLEGMIEKGRIAPKVKGKPKAAASKRGRKSMSAAERLQVSERMARYWAQKRSAKIEPGRPKPGSDEPPSSTS